MTKPEQRLGIQELSRLLEDFRIFKIETRVITSNCLGYHDSLPFQLEFMSDQFSSRFNLLGLGFPTPRVYEIGRAHV